MDSGLRDINGRAGESPSSSGSRLPSMELRSGRRLRRSSPPPPPHGTTSHRMDLISALPDEILLLVLSRLRCVRTAAQTSLLSRRWRGLWTGLLVGPTDLTFRGLAPATIEPLFRRVASPQVPTLDIGLPQMNTTASATWLLRAAVRLSPGHLVFTLQEPYAGYMANIELPCFERTTSIYIDTPDIWLEPLPAGEFSALESLSVIGQIVSPGRLLMRCPRLRVLTITYSDRYILHIPDSEYPALEKLSLSGKIVDPGSLLNSCQRLRVLSVTQLDTRLLHIRLPTSGEFPMLEKLTLSGNIADLGTLLNRCPRLHVLSVTLRGMGLCSLKGALAALEKESPVGLVLSTLGIEIPWGDGVAAAGFTSLLRTMERLSPQELAVTDNFERCYITPDKEIKANLLCFAHATSIEMRLRNVCFKSFNPGEFTMLERLSLSRLYNNVDIGTLVTRCPHLRELKVTVSTCKITVHSASLQKLDVNWKPGTECHGIDIVTPMLKQLHVKARAGGGIRVSISAPMVENVTWQCSYTGSALVFGSWCLQRLRVQTMENVLCLHLNADNQSNEELNFAHEVEKLPFINFSVLEINFERAWHVYGALVLQLLRMRRISVATKNLKVVLSRWPKVKQACLQNCRCDKPKNWRSQGFFSTSLEDVEIVGFNGEDHEYAFLRLVLKCSPVLKSVSVELSYGFEGCTRELSNISLAYPSVEFACG